MKFLFTNIILIFSFVLVCLFISCSEQEKDQVISLKNIKPQIIKINGNEIFQRWTIANRNYLWEINHGFVPSLSQYQDSLQYLLGKQKLNELIYRESHRNNNPDTAYVIDGDLFNYRLVHAGMAGNIRPVNFIEAELLDYQMKRYNMLSHPTEFQAFILMLQDSVRIYFTASDQPWPPKPGLILDSIKVDLKNGWKVQYHLHNHYEPGEKQFLGLLAPSLADAQFFSFIIKDFQLEKALITNTFHTLEINAHEISAFKSH
jgi:hypothetical protein